MSLAYRLILLVALAIAPLAPAAASAGALAEGAERFVDELSVDTIKLISDDSLDRRGKRAGFARLLNKGFDVPAIGRFVLGRYWNIATPEQREEYLKLFERMIVETYAHRFDEYDGQTLEVVGSREEERFALVDSRLKQKAGPPVAVQWRVVKSGDQYKIVDVVVEGVSLSLTQRQEYASVIQNNGGKVEALIDALRRKVQELGAAA